MRAKLVVLHRYAGLFLAAFSVPTALTGSIITWQEELEAWLNPDLYTVSEWSEPLSPIQLAGLVIWWRKHKAGSGRMKPGSHRKTGNQ